MTNDSPFKHKLALITGASRGIGRSSALGLAKSGVHVVCVARTKAQLETLDDEIVAATGKHATLIPLDITDGEAIDRMAQAVFERFGRLDIWVHAAGVLGTLTPVSHVEPKDFDRLIKINLTAGFRLIRALEPLLRRSLAGRAIFLTTSAAVIKGRAFWGVYGATKAAMASLVGTWADELEITAIRVCLLDPGAMRTKMRAAAFPGEDPMSLPHPDEIIPLMVELCDATKSPPLEVQFRNWRESVVA
jgi:NAD(P)-dependent dehydrogenase (short-subunit alcohol dehydrogenase family)